MVFAVETYCPASDGVFSAARIEEEVILTPSGPKVVSGGRIAHRSVLTRPKAQEPTLPKLANPGLCRSDTEHRMPPPRANIGWIGIGGAWAIGDGGAATSPRAAPTSRCGIARGRRPSRSRTSAARRSPTTLADLAACDIVFCHGVDVGRREAKSSPVRRGLLSGAGKMPKLVVECSSISLEGSAELRALLAPRAASRCFAGGTRVGQRQGDQGRDGCRSSARGRSPRSTKRFRTSKMIAPASSYVGEGELARIVKICHNVLLGVVTQSLAEITVLAQKAGVPRHAFLDFINQSVMGSTFSKLQDAGASSISTSRSRSRRSSCARTSTSASTRRAASTCRCRSLPPPATWCSR